MGAIDTPHLAPRLRATRTRCKHLTSSDPRAHAHTLATPAPTTNTSLTLTAQTERSLPDTGGRHARHTRPGCKGRSEGRTPSLPRPGLCVVRLRGSEWGDMHAMLFREFLRPRLPCQRAALHVCLSVGRVPRPFVWVLFRVSRVRTTGGRRKPRTACSLCY